MHKEEDQPSETVIVTIHSDRLAQIEDVAEKLRAAGMVVDQVFKSLGQVTGQVPTAAMNRLRAVEQVESVSPQRMMGIAPPDSEIQ